MDIQNVPGSSATPPLKKVEKPQEATPAITTPATSTPEPVAQPAGDENKTQTQAKSDHDPVCSTATDKIAEAAFIKNVHGPEMSGGNDGPEELMRVTDLVEDYSKTALNQKEKTAFDHNIEKTEPKSIVMDPGPPPVSEKLAPADVLKRTAELLILNKNNPEKCKQIAAQAKVNAKKLAEGDNC